MELHYQFKAGMRQSVQAKQYFQSVASDMLEQWLAELHPVQYLFEEQGYPPLAMRLWSTTGNRNNSVQGLLPWLRVMVEHGHVLGTGARDLERLLPSIMKCKQAEAVRFIEVLDPSAAFSARESNLLCMGMVKDEMVLFSAKNFLCVRLEEALYGVVVHGRGSWLVENPALARSAALQHAGHA